jgi:hypothetical protein
MISSIASSHFYKVIHSEFILICRHLCLSYAMYNMKGNSPDQKKKRRISSKEMFRTIAFEYRQDDKISIDLLSDIVSNLFYPN